MKTNLYNNKPFACIYLSTTCHTLLLSQREYHLYCMTWKMKKKHMFSINYFLSCNFSWHLNVLGSHEQNSIISLFKIHILYPRLCIVVARFIIHEYYEVHVNYAFCLLHDVSSRFSFYIQSWIVDWITMYKLLYLNRRKKNGTCFILNTPPDLPL